MRAQVLRSLWVLVDLEHYPVCVLQRVSDPVRSCKIHTSFFLRGYLEDVSSIQLRVSFYCCLKQHV